MATVEKISIALSPDLAATVRDAVAAGKYASASEVVREALRDWQLRNEFRKAELARLRKAWRDGIESGPPQPLDMEAVKTSARTLIAGVRQSRA